MRRIFMLLAIFIITGCSNESTDSTTSESVGTEAFPVTVTDATGEEITIEETPESIVSLVPSNTEIVYELGLGDKVVGVTTNDNYPIEVLDVEKVGDMTIDVEKIISLNPDLVLAHESALSMSEDAFNQLENAGINVFVVDNAENFEQTYETIETIGEITGTKKEAEEIVSNMQEDFEALQEKASTIPENERKSVWIEVSSAPELYVAGQDTMINEMLEIVGAENVVTESGWLMYSEEQAVLMNPDVILTTYGSFVPTAVDDVLARPAWKTVPAVQNNEVYNVNNDTTTRQGPRLVEGAKEIAEYIYPEVYKD